jgi:threonine aldolase
MADKLAARLAAVGLAPVWPIEANLVFVVLSRALDAKLKAAGARYYGRTNTGLKLGPDQILARLVTSFATQEDEIDRFVHLCKDF